MVRDGTTERTASGLSIADGEILRVWLVVDNAADTFAVHAALPGQPPVRITAGGTDTFAFRTPAAAPLVTYLHLNDPDAPPTSDTWIDSIFVDPDAVTLSDPTPAFAEVVDFEGYAPGALGGQDGWVAPAPAVAVTTDPVDPAGQSLRMDGPNLIAHRALPPIPDSGRGTIFFRINRAGPVDTSLGLSDVDNPRVFADFEVQANSQRSAVLNTRPRAGFAAVGTWAEDNWQCVWMVVDQPTDTYEFWSRGGEYSTTTRLPVGSDIDYLFRNGTTAALGRFFAINGAMSANPLWIDDIAMDTTGRNLRVPGPSILPGSAGDPCPATDVADLPIADPIPESPIPGIGMQLDEFTTLPATSGSAPRARINYLGEVPDGSGRFHVPDLNGPLYLLAPDGAPAEYLDADEVFADFVRSPGLGTGLGFSAFHPEFATNGRFFTVHTEAGAALSSQTPDLPAPAGTSVHGVVTEWTATDPAAGVFAGTRREVLRLGFDTFLHGIQQIDFRPGAAPGDEDYGLLYIGAGDGETVPAFTDGPQDLGMPQGKVLRIDPSGTDGAGGGYGVPPTNPFVGDAGALGEVWALGFRNPHRFSWDPATGAMYLGMIGESSVDAVYELRAGDNAGWNEREGGFRFDRTDPTNVYPLPEDDEANGYTYPVASYDKDTGLALVGGFVYRGTAVPELTGKYVFGDVVNGRIFYTEVADMVRGAPRAPIYEFALTDAAGMPTTMRALAGVNRVDFRLGTDAAGELFVLAKANGRIWRVTSAESHASCQTGDTVVTDVMDREDWAPQTPSKWQFPGTEVILAQAGTNPGPPRRPFEFAVLEAGPAFESVQIDAEVRLDTPVSISNRDVILVFGYQSATEYYYVHLSQDNTILPHNGIFVVDDADRVRLDDQWNGVDEGAPPAVTDAEWHQVRVRHCVDTGEIAVFMDGSDVALMTATDDTFGSGRVGFGSFDNIGRIRDLTVTGTAVAVPDTTAPTTAAMLDPAPDDQGEVDGPVTVTLTADDGEGSGVAAIEQQVDGGAWAPYTGPFTVEGVGPHTVAHRATDVAGNVGEPGSVSFTILDPDPVDTDAPVVTATTFPESPTGAAGWFTTAPVAVLLDAEDPSGVDRIRYAIDRPDQAPGPWRRYADPVALIPDGVAVVRYDARDVLGNQSDTGSLQVSIDTVAPSTVATTNPDVSGGMVVRAVAVTLAAADATSGVAAIDYQVDDGPWTTYTSAFPVIGDGQHVVRWRATDVAGNVEAVEELVFTIDATGPLVTATTAPAAPDGADGWFTSAPVEVSLTSEDAASIRWRVDGGAWTAYTDPFTIAAEGRHVVEFAGSDDVGNTSEVGILAVDIDTVAPTATGSTNPATGEGPVAGPVAVTLAAADATSGVERILYSLDGAERAPYAGAFAVGGAGPHSVVFAAIDHAGNVGTPQTLAFTIEGASEPDPDPDPDPGPGTGPPGTGNPGGGTPGTGTPGTGTPGPGLPGPGSPGTGGPGDGAPDGEPEGQEPDEPGSDDETPPASDGDVTTARHAGDNRIATAAVIAGAAFPDGAPTAYLARADVFADALAAGGLPDGPVLLVPSCGAVPGVVLAAVAALDPDRVVALGGPTALCEAVLVEAAGNRPAARIAGDSRTATAVAIAQAAFPAGADRVYLAAADDRPDAVAAGTLTGGPILLVGPDGPDPVVLAEIGRLAPDVVVALGGAAAVPEEVLQLAADGRETLRLAGPDRIATAVAISEYGFSAAGLDQRMDRVYLARADVVADAVAGGALTDGPILLVPSCGALPPSVAAHLAAVSVDQVVALGGTSAVCDDLLAAAAAAAGDGAG